MASQDKRHWLSPLTMVLFAAIGVTGILMWLDLRVPGVRLLHEIGGVLFTAAAAAHLAQNWRPFCACFRRRTAWLTLLTAIALCAAVVLLDLAHGGEGDGEHRGGHERHETRSGSR